MANLGFVYGHGGAASRTPPALQRLFERIADRLAVDERLPALHSSNFDPCLLQIIHFRHQILDRAAIVPTLADPTAGYFRAA